MQRHLVMLLPGLLLAVAVANSAAQRGAAPSARLAPPPDIACDRNRLTSYSGRVTAFRRASGGDTVTIETDWGSLETFTVGRPGQAGPAYLLAGAPMQAEDWSTVLNDAGEPRQDLGAIAWVCGDPPEFTVIDWRPGGLRGEGV